MWVRDRQGTLWHVQQGDSLHRTLKQLGATRVATEDAVEEIAADVTLEPVTDPPADPSSVVADALANEGAGAHAAVRNSQRPGDVHGD